jgi:nitrite reductase/ring-hydroxylating ferredoxin subunit
MLALGFGLNAIAGAAVGIPLLGYVLSSFLKPHQLDWVSPDLSKNFPKAKPASPTSKVPVKRSWDGPTADIPCWVRRIQGNEFQVFAINCAHLGCPVRWFEESKLFMCPCHGGAYYEDGPMPPVRLHAVCSPDEFKIDNGNLMILAGALPTLAQPNA